MTQSVRSYDIRSAFLRTITHDSTSKGEENICVDLLTRWFIPLKIRHLVTIPPLPNTPRNFVWPTIDAILESQRAHPPPPQGVVLEEGVYRIPSKSPIWIPDEEAILQLDLSIITHTGAAGHRGRQANENALSDRFM